ncbi:hypothetical protein BBK36DRAFT_1123219 [Trichoderma citrinoviride]|uniref:CFEM domain-containing protein n=1 Tax=Trichoderma citrinoviride TaxID=58853 RepID=A0A2T4B5C8_9HYPO|nr:hypothetical protein BBK36DRAFT_1123219 [Trichoderma citrinoviride]PTB64524.1 hypothetical protein BBK36DRAFT_1123219 [Trichoderma citrinoviride]
MRYLLPAVLGALSLIYVDGVAAQDTPACVPTCANQVRGQFAQYGCVNADDAACLCSNANFGFGVRDCGQTGCGATDVQIQAYLAGSFCQGQQLAFTPTGAPAASTAPAAAETSAPAGETTPVPTEPPASTTSVPETAVQTSPPTTAPPSTTEQVTTTAPATAPAQTSAPSTTTASPSGTTSAVSSETSPPATTTSADSSTSVVSTTSTPTASETSEAAPAAGGGLSQGAAIGIGLGVAVAVVGIGLAAAFWFLKNRSRTHDSFDISQPPPSSGHGQGAFEKYSNDIEMVSNRYEDMVPRQQPRAMV